MAYSINCQGCEDVYVRETARNANTRGTVHAKYFGNEGKRSALWRHCVEKREREKQVFQMSVTGNHSNDVMLT